MIKAAAKAVREYKPATEAKTTLRVRDRILLTASELFYRRGIRAVGIDSIVSEADTNKMSFYRNFGSKDELVAEYLRDQERRGWEWWDRVIAAHEDAREKLEALFEAHVQGMNSGKSRGCALVNAAIEITADMPAWTVVERQQQELRSRFRKLARDMRAHEADALGDGLMLLWEGSYLIRVAIAGSQWALENVVRAACSLMDA